MYPNDWYTYNFFIFIIDMAVVISIGHMCPINLNEKKKTREKVFVLKQLINEPK